MKKSLLDKMPGDAWQRFANLRLFYAWQYAHPGKKLLFMGGEFGQWNEWNEAGPLDWMLLDFPAHDSIRTLLHDLNHLYRNEPALHEYDFDPRGFRWIDCHDADQSVLSLVRQGQDAERADRGPVQFHAGAASSLSHRRAVRRSVVRSAEYRFRVLRRQQPR